MTGDFHKVRESAIQWVKREPGKTRSGPSQGTGERHTQQKTDSTSYDCSSYTHGLRRVGSLAKLSLKVGVYLSSCSTKFHDGTSHVIPRSKIKIFVFPTIASMLSLRRLFSRKCNYSIPSKRHLSTTRQSLPWFVDPDPDPVPQNFIERVPPPHLRHDGPPPVPHDAPQPLKELHAQLSQSPHLDQTKLLVARPSDIPEGPPLPDLPERLAQGRRKRGRTYAGEGIPMTGGGIWRWLLLAQASALFRRAASWELISR